MLSSSLKDGKFYLVVLVEVLRAEAPSIAFTVELSDLWTVEAFTAEPLQDSTVRAFTAEVFFLSTVLGGAFSLSSMAAFLVRSGGIFCSDFWAMICKFSFRASSTLSCSSTLSKSIPSTVLIFPFSTVMDSQWNLRVCFADESFWKTWPQSKHLTCWYLTS